MKRETKYRIIGGIFVLPIFILVACWNNKTKGELKPIDIQTAQVELGKKLFLDKRLSSTGEISCASCHRPEQNFADNLKFSKGVNGHFSQRNTPSITYAGKQPHFMFEGLIPNLEMQALVPLLDSNEMGNEMSLLLRRLSQINFYQTQAKILYKRPFDAYVLTRSLSSYVKSLSAKKHPFLAFVAGKKSALTKKQRRGFYLFDHKLKCTSCHQLPYLTNHSIVNNGLAINKHKPDYGRYRGTNKPSDYGAFKVPSLLGLLKTNPYMHDGRFKTIRAVLNHYEKGGSSVANKDPRIQPFSLTAKEKSDLLAFLRAL